MTAQTYKLDFGGDSPFQVLDGSGNVMFDARYASLKVEQKGYVNIGGRFFSPTFGSDAWAEVFLSRPRPAGFAAMWTGVSYGVGDSSNTIRRTYGAPSMAYSSGTGFMCGWLAFAYNDRFRFVNMSPDHLNIQGYPGGARSTYYCIFDGSVNT